MPVDNAKAGEVWARYQWLRDNGHLDYVGKAEKCENFFEGLQWDRADLALLKATRRPALTINKIISTIANVMGEQIFNRTEIAFRPRNEGATQTIADTLTKVFMQISDNNNLPWIRSDVFADGIIGSRGFYDVRLDFTDSLMGELRITQLNPKHVLIDQDADTYDPDGWADVLTTRWMSLDEIELMYSKADAERLASSTGAYFPYGIDFIDYTRDRFGTNSLNEHDEESRLARRIRVVERQWRKLDRQLHFVDIITGDTRPVPSEWSDEQIQTYLQQNPGLSTLKKLVHRIRWTVVADNVVLHDDWSPYKHFTVVPYFPFFRRGHTVGLVENLLGPQELLNKVSSQELHVVNTTANSGWIVKTGTLTNMSLAELELRGAQTGLVIEVNDPDAVQKIQPNQIPSGLDRISYKAEEHIKGISGVSDYMQGFAREDVAAKSVLANKQSGQANLAKVMDNLNRSDYFLARAVLDCVQSYYTEPRLLYITQDRITGQAQPLEINQPTPEGTILNDLTVGEYMVVVTNQPERETFEDTQFDQAVRLRLEAGIPIPDKYIIQSSKLRDKAAIVQELEGNQDSPEAQAQAQLQMREREAQVAKLEAEAQSTMADVEAKKAKAQQSLATAQEKLQGPQEDPVELELMKMEQEYKLQMEKINREFALKREMMERELELKRQEAAEEARLEQEKAREEAMNERILAVSQARATERAPQEQNNGGAGQNRPR